MSILLLFVLFPYFVQATEIFEKYTHETVLGPVVDGVGLEIPEVLGNFKLARLGLVDVTAAPFFADATGKKDSTPAIQAAVNYARDHQMVCYFPVGTYMVSDTISCVQNLYRRSNGKITSARNFPCILMGSRQGERAIIYLKPNAKGFGSRLHPKYVIHFWARSEKDPIKPAPPVSKNQMFINIDITIGSGNHGAVAIRHRGAQGSGIQESTIRVGDGLTGIEGGCGSGGSHTDITIIGGKIGLDLRETQPAPSITGIHLIGQQETAIFYQGRQALSATGVNIEFSGKYTPIISTPPRRMPFHGQICLIDSKISCSTPGPAFDAGSSIYLKNVYVKNVTHIIAHDDSSVIPEQSRNKWTQLQEYTYTVQPQKWRGWQYDMSIFINGTKQPDNIRKLRQSDPPDNLVSSHLWPHNFPSWETPGAVNVKESPYNAKGDGFTDDTQSIQQAIDNNEIIFLPKGYYNISSPLTLKTNTKLIGVARHLSIITSRKGCTNNQYLPKLERQVPLIQSSRDSDSETLIAFIGLHTPYNIPETYSLDWQSNGILRDINFDTLPPFAGYGKTLAGFTGKRRHPLLLISGNGSGKIFNFFQEDGNPSAFGELYSHIGIKNAEGPVEFYQCNAERSQGEANIRIEGSSGIFFYGLKSEGNQPVMLVNKSSNVHVFGYGGNGAAHEGNSLFIIEDSFDCSFVNIVDSPRLSGQGIRGHQEGLGVDPDKWNMMTLRIGKTSFRTPFLERPLLFKTSKKSRLN